VWIPEILNVPCRHGFKPFSLHSRDTHVCDTYTPSVLLIYTISIEDQCEIPGEDGGVVLVNARTSSEPGPGSDAVRRAISYSPDLPARTAHSAPASYLPSVATPPTFAAISAFR
jgi:hypothetical protein